MSESKCRCPWLDLTKPDYVKYHDEEWGVPVKDDQTMFEFLTLESAQAGLSWYTVLKKRDNYRNAFANFDVQKVAQFTPEYIETLMQDSGLIRNRLKLNAAVNNAQRFIEIQQEFGSFCEYIWGFVEQKPIISRIKTLEDYPATTEISDKLSKDLKKRGFKFVGPTIVYAHMQACGMVNDHSEDCYRKTEVEALTK